MSPAEALEKAVALHRAGNLDEAEQIYRAIIAHVPDAADAHHLLALILASRGLDDEAVSSAETAFQLMPGHQPFAQTLAQVLTSRGLRHQQEGARSVAEADYRRAVALNPANSVALSNLGTLAKDDHRSAEAESLFRQAIAADVSFLPARHNLATLKLDQLDLKAALAEFDHLINADPRRAESHIGRGNCLRLMGDPAEAEGAFLAAEAVAASAEERARARINRGVCLLQQKRFHDGWSLYQERVIADPVTCGWRDLGLPVWAGEPLRGRIVHVWLEQGLGDQILFATLLPDLIAEARHVIVECEPRLVSVLQRSLPQATILPRLAAAHPRLAQGDIDVSVPSGSLALLYRNSLADFPDPGLRLVPDPVRLASFQAQLAALGPGLKAGFAWRSLYITAERAPWYMPAEHIAGLAGMAGIVPVCLQYGHQADELAHIAQRAGRDMVVMPGLDLIADIDGVIALSAALDLVISPSSTAGALAALAGTDVFQFGVAPSDIDALGTHYVPWFPAMTCFRKSWNADWQGVVADMAVAIRARARGQPA